MKFRLAPALGALALTVIPAAALAAPDFNTPPYAYEDQQREEIAGTVARFWPFNADLFGGRHLDLHEGTIIRPTGITLQRGMHVRVFGHWRRDGSFRADEIDLVSRRWHERDDD